MAALKITNSEGDIRRKPVLLITPFKSYDCVLAFVRFFRGVRPPPPNLIFIGILQFLLLRSPCKNLKSYDNPLWGKGRGGNNKKKKRKKYLKFR